MARTIAPLDLLFLLAEVPDVPTHVGCVMIFDYPARHRHDLVPRVVRAYRRARPRAPFNQVPELLTAGLPRWRAVSRVDLDYHVEHLLLPPGASEETFLRLIEDLQEPVLDRNRPGFRVWLIEGLPGRRFAFYFKVHHSIIDGVSAMARIVASLSPSPGARLRPPFYAVDVDRHRPTPPTSLISQVRSLLDTALRETSAVRELSVRLARQAFDYLLTLESAGSQPPAGPTLPLNIPTRAPRSFAMLSLPLAEMRAVGRAFGGTLNDVAATIVDAGLQRYLADAGKRPSRPLVAVCPVSVREPGDTTATNLVSTIFAPLGAPDAPILERMQQVLASLHAAKDQIRSMSKEAAQIYVASMLGFSAAAEVAHLSSMTGRFANFVLSNVPGTDRQHYLGEARLRGIFPVSALGGGIGLNVTVASHANIMGFGFVGNKQALPDLAPLARYTGEAFAELKAAARGPRVATPAGAKSAIRRASRRAAR